MRKSIEIMHKNEINVDNYSQMMYDYAKLQQLVYLLMGRNTLSSMILPFSDGYSIAILLRNLHLRRRSVGLIGNPLPTKPKNSIREFFPTFSQVSKQNDNLKPMIFET